MNSNLQSAATSTTLPVGYVFDILFPNFTPRIKIESETQLSFEIIEGGTMGMIETVDYQAINLRPGLFVVTWQEKSRATVTHIEDFATGQVHTNVTLADNTFLRMSGKIRDQAVA